MPGRGGGRGTRGRGVTFLVCPSSKRNGHDICVSSCVTKSGLSLKDIQFHFFQVIDEMTPARPVS